MASDEEWANDPNMPESVRKVRQKLLELREDWKRLGDYNERAVRLARDANNAGTKRQQARAQEELIQMVGSRTADRLQREVLGLDTRTRETIRKVQDRHEKTRQVLRAIGRWWNS